MSENSSAQKERFYSYAQELEDLILYNVLKDVSCGFYIDVGANDPVEISVTNALYERGFCGINIEPLEDKIKLLTRQRPRDINLQMGISNEDGELTLYEMGFGSTFDADIAESLSKAGERITKKSIPVTTLSKICETHASDKIIHFCKIDVEGFEKQVLEGMDFSRFKPFVMVMEAAIPGSSVPNHDKWEHILFANDYELAFAHHINRYYTHKSKGHLKDRFLSIEDLEKKYDIYTFSKKTFKNRLKRFFRFLFAR